MRTDLFLDHDGPFKKNLSVKKEKRTEKRSAPSLSWGRTLGVTPSAAPSGKYLERVIKCWSHFQINDEIQTAFGKLDNPTQLTVTLQIACSSLSRRAFEKFVRLHNRLFPPEGVSTKGTSLFFVFCFF